MSTRVCLISPGHIASTPRLVKEADALVAAGYEVHVVASQHFAPVVPLDASILAKARWRFTPLTRGSAAGSAGRKVAHRVARALRLRWPVVGARLAAHAQHAETLRLAETALSAPAALYLGHCLAGLAAAGIAARRQHALLGFDAEDFHRGETSLVATPHVLALENYWLPRCQHRTASAPLIAQAYAEACDIPPPTVVLNVFPLAEGPAAPVDPDPIDSTSPARLYWFSQTIGPGRGLEEILAIMGRMRTPVTLELRGFVSADYRAQLEKTASAEGVTQLIQFPPSVPPRVLASLAARAHLGLSLELPTPPNHDLCLANKIFTYLLAGIPQVLSDTRGQRALSSELGEAALLVSLARPDESAQRLDALLGDPVRLAGARAVAWKLARERFCWDREQEKFLAAIGKILPLRQSA